MRDLWVWRYALEAKGPLNAKTDRVFNEGALVREGAGFGCVHPWPELGDATLEECLADLASERKLSLVRRTAACLQADGEARMAGCSLFEGLEVPVSHATLPGWTRAGVEESAGRGFEVVKVKAGREIEQEMTDLRGLVRDFPDLKWRVDFNEQGCGKELVRVFSEWSEEELGRVDFLEDPVVYGGEEWTGLRRATGLALANDRAVEEEGGDSEVLVVKPAVNEMKEGARVVVTSYLDHPLGQAFAAWEAARSEVREVCGLQTHGVFAEDEFTEVLGEVRPQFRVPGGSGLGFGDLLERLPWTKLKP